MSPSVFGKIGESLEDTEQDFTYPDTVGESSEILLPATEKGDNDTPAADLCDDTLGQLRHTDTRIDG